MKCTESLNILTTFLLLTIIIISKNKRKFNTGKCYDNNCKCIMYGNTSYLGLSYDLTFTLP